MQNLQTILPRFRTRNDDLSLYRATTMMGVKELPPYLDQLRLEYISLSHGKLETYRPKLVPAQDEVVKGGAAWQRGRACVAALVCGAHAAVLPPPWADVRRNPCAAHPRGWLMLYWPKDGNCYTIYQVCDNRVEKGHPCPENQELNPGRWGSRTIAECKCPPGAAQLPHVTKCHDLFGRGPCRSGEYFAPVEESFNKRGERQGMCVRPQQCADETLLFWPADGRCHYRLTQGPCYPGTILELGTDGLANCTCNATSAHYWPADGGCYAHYSRGPCERGQLFLPGGRCGCDPTLPHYHASTDACYEIDSIGPCPKGHIFSITEVNEYGSKAECTCKAFHARAADGVCYRLYTRGPCAHDEMISRGGRCTKVGIAAARLGRSKSDPNRLGFEPVPNRHDIIP
ncbi:hypothetical protein EVAR_43000_1 [Eumeta japonica]|uniref:DUF4789 domain-containing protein n=1 Tax=Eumeta variegata TaxID=151549 RepID=A0A4C1WBK2_EUMVA|nr:hypothetical protein EVAR_43000_1 [Eumeta japonica]